MAIQVNGTTVIDNSRVLSNVTGFDAATSSLIQTSAGGINDYYYFTTTSLSPTVSGGSSPYVAFQSTTTYPPGEYEIVFGTGAGPNAPWWNAATSSRSKLPGPNDYFGQAAAICAKIGSNYYPLRYTEALASSASTDYLPSIICSYFNNPSNNLIFNMTSTFSIALCFGTYTFSPQNINSPITAWGNRGSYRINSGSSFGWAIKDAYSASGPTS